MARSAPAPVDPLADLRPNESDEHTLPPAEPEQAPVKVQVNAAYMEQAAKDTVAQWHGDTTAAGILHRGGTCGCWYLARSAHRTALEQLEELEPSGAS